MVEATSVFRMEVERFGKRASVDDEVSFVERVGVFLAKQASEV